MHTIQNTKDNPMSFLCDFAKLINLICTKEEARYPSVTSGLSLSRPLFKFYDDLAFILKEINNVNINVS